MLYKDFVTNLVPKFDNLFFLLTLPQTIIDCCKGSHHLPHFAFPITFHFLFVVITIIRVQTHDNSNLRISKELQNSTIDEFAPYPGASRYINYFLAHVHS